jgi:hypothetical protein
VTWKQGQPLDEAQPQELLGPEDLKPGQMWCEKHGIVKVMGIATSEGTEYRICPTCFYEENQKALTQALESGDVKIEPQPLYVSMGTNSEPLLVGTVKSNPTSSESE